MIGLITTALRAVVKIATSALTHALIITGIQQLVAPPEIRTAATAQEIFLDLLPQALTLATLTTLGATLAGPPGRFTGYILALTLISYYTQRRRAKSHPAPLVIEVTPIIRHA